MSRYFVAMSGGVDSSVAALLLSREGHDVFGVTMLLTPDGGRGACCGSNAAREARLACAAIGIPHVAVDLRGSFAERVMAPFARAYAEGRTPNPCIACNDAVKFGELLERVLGWGADGMATGHYARVGRDADGRPTLDRARDSSRDQSYFLYRMTREQLESVAFPLGELSKTDVRRIAAEAGLPTAASPESREICFVAEGERAAFVAEAHPGAAEPGAIVDASGRRVGEHAGLASYTVGQRHGLRIGGGGPYYVTKLLPEENVVVVGGAAELEARSIAAEDVVWRGGREAGTLGCAVRYRQAPVRCSASLEGERLRVELSAPLVGVAPGQAVVCYEGETVVGGGTIVEAA